MKVDTMRRVDFFVGIPLCLLATLALKLLALFSTTTAKRPTRVLFLELSEMGSAVLVDPAMRKMRGHGAELFFVIFAKNVASLRLLSTVPEANIFTIREDGLVHLAWDTLGFLLWTRRCNIDTVIDLELFSRYTALLTGLSGAVNRIGFHGFHNEGLYRGAMLTHRVLYNSHLHIARNFIALVNAVLAPAPELPFSKTRVEDAEIRLARAQVRAAALAAMTEHVREVYPDYQPDRNRLVLINPNASELLPQRRWMPEHFVTVMRSLLSEYPDVVILITGGGEERRQAEDFRQRVNDPRCRNFAGQITIEELPALYSIARLMLTNDSGPGHFSAVTELRTLVLFGPETPALYGSLGNSLPIYAALACSPCVSAANHRKTPCRDNVCLKVILPAQVLALIRTELDADQVPGAAVSAARSERIA
jgi:ADP-heptose:LPS heptosyltransferase